MPECRVCRKRMRFWQRKHRNHPSKGRTFFVHDRCLDNPHKRKILKRGRR